MNYQYRHVLKILICAVILCLSAGFAFAQITTTQNGSLSLDGSGTLTYTLTRQTLVPCNPNAHVKTPSFSTWVYSNFSYTDPTGAVHPLTGQVAYTQVNGSGTGCPPSGGTSDVLNGQNFFIDVLGGPGSLTASLNVLLFPQFYVMSVLYAPPGNQSNNGFTDTSTEAATTSISKSFQVGTMLSADISLPGGSGAGVKFGATTSTQNSSAFTMSTSDASGVQVASNRNPVDHTQDQIFLWLNPAVTVTPTSITAGNYNLGTPTGSNGQPQPMDIINIPVTDLQNPSQIPLALLLPQSRTNSLGVTISGLPGLASICRNPVPQCTASPCGCVTSDFVAILAADPLIGSGSNVPPSQIDPNRYKFITSESLQGPACVGCDDEKNIFTATDGTTTAETETDTFSYSVGYSVTSGFKLLGAGFKVTDTNTFTWTNSESVGMSDGTSHSASVTLASSSVDCVETVNVYEDTVYHTFAFAPNATPPAACN
jgi:hypothetical protein